uniref:BLVR domain-containing protein n=1 Tax=Soboliphyme baturini TaxID=241478 RepID=A0A183IAG1_9BILA
LKRIYPGTYVYYLSINLDDWINPPEEDENKENERSGAKNLNDSPKMMFSDLYSQADKTKAAEPSAEDLKRRRRARMAVIESNPNYLKGKTVLKKHGKGSKSSGRATIDAKSPNNMHLPTPVPLDLEKPVEIKDMIGLEHYAKQLESTVSWEKVNKSKRGGNRKKNHGDMVVSSDDNAPEIEINRDVGEMPENAQSTDEEQDSSVVDPFKALDINIEG